ncbi:MAG: periplasmic heavy metal sensor [Rhodospirillaceae bacterium]|nr:periplasmic heavy metal sensor [Rhodospirillaceae bacterium]
MMNRKLTWILLASLLINAALVGFLIGNHGRGGPRDFLVRRGPPGMMQGRADESARGVLRDSFSAERDNLEKAAKDVAEARRESEAILRADPLDIAKLDESMARLRGASRATQEAFHRALRDAATKLDATQRAALGRMLERAPTGRMGNQRGGPGSGALSAIGNGPPPGPAPTVRPLPDGMGLGAPLSPPPPGE